MRIDDTDVVYVVQVDGVYDGWSIAVLADGRRWNRWGNPAQTGPKPGYERRYAAVEAYLAGDETNERRS